MNKFTKTLPIWMLAASNMAFAARNNTQACEPSPPATCYPDDCCRTYCMGPDNYAVLAPVRPYTCDGDWVVTVAGFYWNAHQDGMEYAVKTGVQTDPDPLVAPERSNIISAQYENPNFKWDFGFKLGLGYNTTCDGWDFGVVWTRYRGNASSHVEAEQSDNNTLLPIWSDFSTTDVNPAALGNNLPLFATDIQTSWKLNLDLIDVELGRDSWFGKRLALRPHIGLRVAYIRQSYEIQHKGGTWSILEPTTTLTAAQNNIVDIDNNYKAVGIRGGLNGVWNFGCGWALYGDTALSILYGRFRIDHDEWNRSASSPFDKTKIMETENSFRLSTLAVDLGLGLQWSALFCDCNYAFTAKFGWENHLFQDQNQMWRVTKISNFDLVAPTFQEFANNFSQRRGTLSTQGWTLTLILDF